MLPGYTYSIGPVKVAGITEDARIVHRTLAWLEEQQNPADGSWGSKSLKEKTLATCQTVMALLACGYPTDEWPVAGGIDWLARNIGSPENEQYHFHLAGPFLNIKGYEPLVDLALKQLKHQATTRAAASSRHSPRMLLIEALKLWEVPADNSEVREQIEALKSEWDRKQGAWHEHQFAQLVAHGMLVMSMVPPKNGPKRAEILKKSREWLIDKADQPASDEVSWDEDETYTAYVIMDLVDSGISRNDPLWELMKQATKWLIGRREEEGYWQVDLSKHSRIREDVPNPDYYTALIVRGIIAFNCAQDPSFPLQVLWLKYQQSQGDSQSLPPNQLTSGFEIAPVSAMDTIGICLNGHTTDPEFKTVHKHCRECGETIIFDCQACRERIPLAYLDDDTGTIQFHSLPNHCHECGASYPWILRKKEAAEKLINELKKLTLQEREELKMTLPDIFSETPYTTGAAMKFKRLITKAGPEGLELLKEVGRELLVEAAKRAIYGQ